MTTSTQRSILILITLCSFIFAANRPINAAGGIIVYTPFTRISVPPGEVIDFTLDIINKSSDVQNLPITVTGLPAGWNYSLKSGSWNIRQMAVLPGEKKSFTLRVEVPLKVEKGKYRFSVNAVGLYSLPLIVDVSEKGTYKTDLTTRQPNMEGHSDANFTFNAELKNQTADAQLYALIARPPRGWDVVFKANYKQVTSVETEANSTTTITIEVKAPENTEAGTYKIPISATTSSTSATLDLEVTITGTFNIVLTTPGGLLSSDVTAGRSRRLELIVRNTGSSELKDINLSGSTPANWEVSFDPKKISALAPGKDMQVFATIKADRKAIAGDYVTTLEARTQEVSSKAAFRISVKTPILWGWIGVLIILTALGSIYYLFRKYGRR